MELLMVICVHLGEAPPVAPGVGLAELVEGEHVRLAAGAGRV